MTHNSTAIHSQSTVPNEVPVQAESVQEIGELTELLRLTDGLPAEYRADFYPVLDRLAACFEHRQRMLSFVQDSLNQMSLDLNYLIFDLEATRRERDEYRQRAEKDNL